VCVCVSLSLSLSPVWAPLHLNNRSTAVFKKFIALLGSRKRIFFIFFFGVAPLPRWGGGSDQQADLGGDEGKSFL